MSGVCERLNMRRFTFILDVVAFVIFGTIFGLIVSVTLIALSQCKRRQRKGEKIIRFSFPIFDWITNKHPSMFEDALLNGYISRDYYVYLDFDNFDNREDRFENINNQIYFHSIAAHPDNGVYNAGFRMMNALLIELKILMRAASIVYKCNVSFVKAHDSHLLGLNGLIIARLFRLPCILHMNTDFEKIYKYQREREVSSPILILRDMVRSMGRSMERIFESFIATSYNLIMADRDIYKYSRAFPEKSREKYRNCGARIDGVHYSPLDSRRDLKGELGLNGNRVVLYVGRLHPVKYPGDAIRAFGKIKKELKDVVLLMVGNGVLKSSLEKMVKRTDLEDSVFFLGPKKPEELKDIFYTADVLVAPHGGVTLVESALASTPVVAYDYDWQSDVLGDGKMGYIVDFGDVEGLAKKTKELLLDITLRDEIRAECRKVAIQRYPREESVQNEKGIYEELMRI